MFSLFVHSKCFARYIFTYKIFFERYSLKITKKVKTNFKKKFCCLVKCISRSKCTYRQQKNNNNPKIAKIFYIRYFLYVCKNKSFVQKNRGTS